MDDGDARRHQHPGQLHPHQLAGLPAEPSDIRQRRRIHDHTSVSGADTAGGATSVRMVTPSGINRFTGSAFEFYRDAGFAANSFFNNSSDVAKPDLSRHQFGGRVRRTRSRRDRIFFFGYYEGFRQTTQTAQNLTIPANPDLLNGVFRYAGTDGVVRSVNVMQLSACPSIRSCGLTSFRRSQAAIERQQLRHRQLDRGANAEHRRLPVQPDRPEQPRPVRLPRSITR